MNRCRLQTGFTLVELVVALVILSVGVAGVLLLVNKTTRHSADPAIQEQAIAIAEAYLDEVLLKPFADPDGVDGESGRVNFDDVDDYDGWSDTGAKDQFGTAIAGLGAYRVDVTVTHAALGSIGAADALRVAVRVRHGNLVDLTLAGYRTSHW